MVRVNTHIEQYVVAYSEHDVVLSMVDGTGLRKFSSRAGIVL